MNVLSDYIIRLEKKVKRVYYKGIPVDELKGDSLTNAISDYEGIVKMLKQKMGPAKKVAEKKSVRSDKPKEPSKGSRKKEK